MITIYGAPEIKNTKYATTTQYRVFLYFFFRAQSAQQVRNKYAKWGYQEHQSMIIIDIIPDNKLAEASAADAVR